MSPDFSEIGSGEDFELFVADLLRELGWSIISAPGRGPDRGVDIIATPPADPSTGATTRFLIQCKHILSRGRAVGLKDLNSGPSIADLLLARGAQGYLLTTSTTVSQAVQSHFEDLMRATGRPYLIWDRSVLTSRMVNGANPS